MTVRPARLDLYESGSQNQQLPGAYPPPASIPRGIPVAGVPVGNPGTPFVDLNWANNERYRHVRDYKPNLRYKFSQQLMALSYKNGLYQMRQYKSNCCQIAFPIGLILALFILQLIINSIIASAYGSSVPATPRPAKVNPYLLVYKDGYSDDCPQFSATESRIVDNAEFLIASEGNYGAFASPIQLSVCQPGVSWPGPDGSTSGIFSEVSTFPCDYPTRAGFVDPDQGLRQRICGSRTYYTEPVYTNTTTYDNLKNTIFNDFTSRTVPGGFLFKNLDNANNIFEFEVLYNKTVTRGIDMGALVSIITGAIKRSFFTPSPTGSPPAADALSGIRDFPAKESKPSVDIISLIGPTLYIYIFQLPFPVILGGLVLEKEKRLREIMKMMGLKSVVYWIVSYIFYFLIYILSMLLMCILAIILDFRFFRANDFGTYFIMLILFGNVSVAASFFFASFLSNSRTATVVGYIYVFISGIISSEVITSYFQSETTPEASIAGISVVPTFALYRGILILKNNVVYNGPGIKMSEISDPEVRLSDVYIFLFVEWLVFLVFAIYCEQVVPDGFGIKKHPLFFLQPSYWKGKANRHHHHHERRKSVVVGEPEDVAAERARVNETTALAVRAVDLQKIYPPRGGAPAKVAVYSLSLGVGFGECFGFLGPNGAGKTSTINMLCGFFMPSSGTATIFENDIHEDIDEIHMLLGVCPQHDLLWDDLTGREHLMFYGRLKNVNGSLLKDMVTYRLAQVNLLEASNKKSREYSGGMKRRLSVAIALMGNPKVVLLDEPSTGLDPASRRALWDVINDYKQHCAMLLTTHSMEEADALCDRLGIFAGGKLRCIGNSADLKRRFGSGFKLTITSRVEYEMAAHEFVMRLVPQAQFLNALAGTRNYELPRGAFRLRDVFAAMERHKEELHITDWAIMNTTLEEVFLRIADMND